MVGHKLDFTTGEDFKTKFRLWKNAQNNSEYVRIKPGGFGNKKQSSAFSIRHFINAAAKLAWMDCLVFYRYTKR